MKKKAIFLDRDGTLIVDTGYPNDPETVTLIDGAGEAMRAFQQAGYLLVVISNQSGIGRGKITPDEAEQVYKRFADLFAKEQVQFDGVYHCPHAPDEDCNCRKPKTGMIDQAVQELDIDVAQSYTIGDKLSDVQTGIKAGTKTILFRDHPSNAGKDIHPDFKAGGWPPIVEYILVNTERQ